MAVVGGLLLALAVGAAAWYWLQRPGPLRIPSAVPAPAATQAAAPASAEPAPPAVQPAPSEHALAPTDIPAALAQFLGRDAVLKFLDTTDFPRKAVATLDNLGREHAPVSAWPVIPMPGRFLAAGDQSSPVIAPGNALRYRPFVAFIDGIDAAQAVDFYRRMYPNLQHAYRELGFADRSFHMRLLEVVELLLATPEPSQPLQLSLAEVKGPVASTRPWTRYEFSDPGLQRLAAGQKMLLRVGPENRKVLKAKLEQIRQQLLRLPTTELRSRPGEPTRPQ